MAHKSIEQGLTKFLNEKMNEGSSNLFVVSKFVDFANEDVSVRLEDKVYSIQRQTFTPVIIQDFDGDFEPIPNVKTANIDIPMEILVRYDFDEGEVLYDSISKDIEDFNNKFIGAEYDLTSYITDEVGTVYNSVWISGLISGNEEEVKFFGKLYKIFTITLTVDLSKNVNYGNATTYYLAKTSGLTLEQKEQVVFLTATSSRAKTMRSTQQTSSSSETKNKALTNAWSLAVAFYDKTDGVITKEIKKSIDDPTIASQNEPYYLTIVDPDYTLNDIKVINDGATKSADLGEKVVISTTFVRGV